MARDIMGWQGIERLRWPGNQLGGETATVRPSSFVSAGEGVKDGGEWVEGGVGGREGGDWDGPSNM